MGRDGVVVGGFGGRDQRLTSTQALKDHVLQTSSPTPSKQLSFP
jgi:hypothetical protein